MSSQSNLPNLPLSDTMSDTSSCMSWKSARNYITDSDECNLNNFDRIHKQIDCIEIVFEPCELNNSENSTTTLDNSSDIESVQSLVGTFSKSLTDSRRTSSSHLRLEKLKSTSNHHNLIEIKDNWKTKWRIPWAILAISTIQIGCYLLHNEVIFNLLIFSPLKRNEIWRFFTYQLLHTGSIHLILNMIIQIIISVPLETEQGHASVATIYFGGVISGSLGASVFQPTLLIVGSSAGVYSILISHLPHIAMNFNEINHRYYRLISVGIICASDIIFTISHCCIGEDSEPKISIAAHICGAISGLLLGFICFNRSLQNNQLLGIFYRSIRTACLIIYSISLTAMVMKSIYGSSNCNTPKI